MSSSSTSVIQPTGLVHGHSECRYLDETIPVLSHILALELVDRRNGEATMKHPNTGWKLILHEGGSEVKDKPERNHYGVRVSNNQEVDNAYQYLLAEKEKLGLKKGRKAKGARRFLFNVLCRARRQLLGNRVLPEPAQSRLAGTRSLSLENQAHGK